MGGGLPLMPVTFVLGTGVSVAVLASQVQGFPRDACLKFGTGYGTCDLSDATVIIVTEEGTGKCVCYAFAERDTAIEIFESRTWRGYSRIMFEYADDVVGSEIAHGGIHQLPYGTIRAVATSMNLRMKAFVQGDTLGLASYHFIDHQTAYISHESEACASWTLDNGMPLPPRKDFTDVSFHAETRTFRGVVSWAPTTFCGDERWEYEMVFDEFFSCLVGGEVHHFTPGVTDRGPREQVLSYVAPFLESNGAALVYRRYGEPWTVLPVEEQVPVKQALPWWRRGRGRKNSCEQNDKQS